MFITQICPSFLNLLFGEFNPNWLWWITTTVLLTFCFANTLSLKAIARTRNYFIITLKFAQRVVHNEILLQKFFRLSETSTELLKIASKVMPLAECNETISSDKKTEFHKVSEWNRWESILVLNANVICLTFTHELHIRHIWRNSFCRADRLFTGEQKNLIQYDSGISLLNSIVSF